MGNRFRVPARRRCPVVPAVLLAQCRRHLATILDNYHDRHWRRAHKGYGTYPHDHLWRAAQAVRELTDAIATTQMSEST
jgi:hypothetical protein